MLVTSIRTERPPCSGGARTRTRRALPADPAFPDAGASVGRWRAKTPGVHREGVQGAAFVLSRPGVGKNAVYVTCVVRTTFYRVSVVLPGWVHENLGES